jgi:hypothetical protein
MFKIRYEYVNPSNAGPFKGGATVSEKVQKGDTYYGPFGQAIVRSCSKVRIKPGNLPQTA